MSTESDPNPATPPLEPAVAAPAVAAVPHSRIGRIVAWSARVTSIPILALVLFSLVPALAHLSVAAREDQILAWCLCGTTAGLLLGWRWPGLGGGLVVASVGLILAQNEDGWFADPFSIAFALQGVLFLLAWALNQPRTAASGVPASLNWVRKAVAVLLALGALTGAAFLLRGPQAEPLPRGKEIYAGAWEHAAGLKFEISLEGKATVIWTNDLKIDGWNLPAVTAGTNTFNLAFRGDDVIELTSGVFSQSKLYHIDRRPRSDTKLTRMVLNGSDPYDPKGGMLLVKRVAGETNRLSARPKTAAAKPAK